ncbi:MAG: LysE family transporter [Flavobacteriales bacterium]|nr:MAG: hypothetical protein F9K28_05890 [Bacteroidota bacterium]KXK34018.1 MAG: LysE type translocator [Chlorobi bacterium OLB6]MBE2265433.1 LysE family transporter [Flavobacteriales bacterium]MBV6463929.1 hypothetical protein [Chlorobiota bacterium]MBW7853963.1 LysE family transporter [Candidatus Kapabacteria bacterium]MCC6331840.1 LysE family transporter [Ignavibacteria bacterium]
MLGAIIIGLAVGYILAIPPGPIGMASIRTGLREGGMPALKLALGAGIFDIVYCALAMVATSAIVRWLEAIEHISPLAPVAIQLVIVGVMIGFGILQMKDREPRNAEPSTTAKPSRIAEWLKGHGPFFVGVGFALANLANPTFIPALAAMTTFIQKFGWFESTVANNVVFSIGFGIGNFLWLFTLVRLVLALRHKMTPTFLRRIQQLSGVTLIGFGTFYGIRIIALTKWPELLRLVFAA